MAHFADTHIHLHDKAFDADRNELISAFKESGIEFIVDIAAEKTSLEKVVALTKEHDFIYGSLGFHPDEVGDFDEESEVYIRQNMCDAKIVAIGEIGLDYHWMTEPKDIQEKAFRKQSKMAKEAGLPIIVHSREAAEDTLRIIEEETDGIKEAIAKKRGIEKDEVTPGIIHCYSYATEQARIYAKLGYMLGIGGVVTYKNGKKLKEVVGDIPLESLVLETDAPYLAPDPFRGKRNDSRMIEYVINEIATLKNVSAEEVKNVTTINAKKVFYKIAQ